MTRDAYGALLVALALALTGGMAAQSSGQKVSGHLVDTVCAKNHVGEAGYATNHENSCNLHASCIKSGYSVMTADDKVFTLDAKGAEQALALVKTTDKARDLRVTVTGRVDGQTIAVESIEID